jgi:hypothetical protein
MARAIMLVASFGLVAKPTFPSLKSFITLSGITAVHQ